MLYDRAAIVLSRKQIHVGKLQFNQNTYRSLSGPVGSVSGALLSEKY
jgi:hypothetical protein